MITLLDTATFFFLSFSHEAQDVVVVVVVFFRIFFSSFNSQLDAIQQAIATRVVLPVIDTNDVRISQQDMFCVARHTARNVCFNKPLAGTAAAAERILVNISQKRLSFDR